MTIILIVFALFIGWLVGFRMGHKQAGYYIRFWQEDSEKWFKKATETTD